MRASDRDLLKKTEKIFQKKAGSSGGIYIRDVMAIGSSGEFSRTDCEMVDASDINDFKQFKKTLDNKSVYIFTKNQVYYKAKNKEPELIPVDDSEYQKLKRMLKINFNASVPVLRHLAIADLTSITVCTHHQHLITEDITRKRKTFDQAHG